MSIEDIEVLVNSDRIIVTDEKACCSHDVLLPYTIKTDSTKAYMDYTLRVRGYIFFFFFRAIS